MGSGPTCCCGKTAHILARQPPTAARDWLIVIASLIVASDDNLARLQVVAADWTQTDKVLLLLLLPPQFSPHKADEKDDEFVILPCSLLSWY